MHVSITRLKLRRWYFLPFFFFFNLFIIRQFRRAPGMIQGKVIADHQIAFWTITLWQHEAAMLAFRNRGMHLKAMAKTPEWASEAVAYSWTCADGDFPTWSETCEKLKTLGHFSTLKHPSVNFQRRKFTCEEKFLNVMFFRGKGYASK